MTNEQGSSVAYTQEIPAGRRALSVAEVADMYGLHPSTVYREIEAGKLMAFGFGATGGAIRVPISALAAFEAASIKVKAA
ncbi:excisionase family DNA binding protein [Catenulispora sp. MAP5-51]|uniref:helix-turn-helix domain-containing protein n=1 Tax=Catenulispora sp. MAP5-51 TaxID=3156298 RepID=UPI003517D48D